MSRSPTKTERIRADIRDDRAKLLVHAEALRAELALAEAKIGAIDSILARMQPPVRPSRAGAPTRTVPVIAHSRTVGAVEPGAALPLPPAAE